jgi:hypothetical protein
VIEHGARQDIDRALMLNFAVLASVSSSMAMRTFSKALRTRLQQLESQLIREIGPGVRRKAWQAARRCSSEGS